MTDRNDEPRTTDDEPDATDVAITEPEEATVSEYAQSVVAAREREEILASIPSTAPNRDELLQEQLVARAEERAVADGKERKLVSEHDGAKFATQDALELHERSFHPDPPEGWRPPTPAVAPIPVRVVDEPIGPKRGRAARSRADED